MEDMENVEYILSVDKQVYVLQIYIINVKSPNLELQPQGISYREREKK